MSTETVLWAQNEGVATITLNRPNRLNALTPQVEEELLAAMQRAEQDDDVRVIVLTGAGKGFCAGADLEALQWVATADWTGDIEAFRSKLLPPRPSGTDRADFERTYSYFPAINKPIIAAINGAAVGLGFVLPLYCDIRIASDRARFGTAFAQRGLIAEHGVAWMLPRLVGVSNTLDLLYSARLIDASEAQRIGLVSQVVEDHKLADTVGEYARLLAQSVSPRSLRVIKRQVYDGLFQSLGDAIDEANDEMITSFQTADFREGIAHFLEKRPPRFSGK